MQTVVAGVCITLYC